MGDYEDWSRDELIERINELEGTSRRSVLKGAATVAALGAAGVYSTRPVEAAPNGVFPESGSDALLKIRADRVRLVPRTTDPSSADNGTLYYRGDI